MKLKAFTFLLAVAIGFVVVSAFDNTRGSGTTAVPEDDSLARGRYVENTVPGDSSVVVEAMTPDGYRFTYGGTPDQAAALVEIIDAVVIER